MDYDKNFPIRPEDVFPSTEKRFHWICSDCGSFYFSDLNHRTSSDRGCPICNSSRMENKIKKFLEKNNISFESQKRFPDCKDIFSLPFDFYIESYNLACEANGRQHYESVKFFGGQEKFEYLQKHDKMKVDYCKEKNIRFLTIKYTEYNNIESILTKELNL